MIIFYFIYYFILFKHLKKKKKKKLIYINHYMLNILKIKLNNIVLLYSVDRYPFI